MIVVGFLCQKVSYFELFLYFQFPQLLHVYHHHVGMEVNVAIAITAMIIPARVSMNLQEPAVNVSNQFKISLLPPLNLFTFLLPHEIFPAQVKLPSNSILYLNQQNKTYIYILFLGNVGAGPRGGG